MILVFLILAILLDDIAVSPLVSYTTMSGKKIEEVLTTEQFFYYNIQEKLS